MNIYVKKKENCFFLFLYDLYLLIWGSQGFTCVCVCVFIQIQASKYIEYEANHEKERWVMMNPIRKQPPANHTHLHKASSNPHTHTLFYTSRLSSSSKKSSWLFVARLWLKFNFIFLFFFRRCCCILKFVFKNNNNYYFFILVSYIYIYMTFECDDSSRPYLVCVSVLCNDVLYYYARLAHKNRLNLE